MVLDVEAGAATMEGAIEWTRAMHSHGMKRPCLYVSLARASPLVKYLTYRGVPRDTFRLWTAHWTGRAHLCGESCGFYGERPGATQWTNEPMGKHYDESIASHAWLVALANDYAQAGR